MQSTSKKAVQMATQPRAGQSGRESPGIPGCEMKTCHHESGRTHGATAGQTQERQLSVPYGSTDSTSGRSDGAGDSFAGGMLGYWRRRRPEGRPAQGDDLGSVMGSFAVEESHEKDPGGVTARQEVEKPSASHSRTCSRSRK